MGGDRAQVPAALAAEPGAVRWPSFIYTDRNFAYGQSESPAPTLVSTVKARLAGFQDCVDTEEMFRRLFARLQELRWLPPRN